MQQSSATPRNQDVGIGLRKIVACSHSSSHACLLISTVFLARCHPYVLLHFYTCFTNFLSRLSEMILRASVHVRTRMRIVHGN